MNKTNLLLIIILAVLLVVGGYLIFSEKLFSLPQGERDSMGQPPLDKTPKQTPEQEPSPSPSAPSETPDSWKTYQDSEGGFEFQYPSDFVLYNSDHPDFPQGSFFKTDGNGNVPVPIRVVAALLQDAYPNTDFVGAWGAVAYAPQITTGKECRYFEKNNVTEKLSQIETINGVTWYSDTIAGAAAGTTIKNFVYHTLYNQTCYELDLNLAISTIYEVPLGFPSGHPELAPGNPPAQVNAFEVWNRLFDILYTFRFLREASLFEDIPCESTAECTKLAIKEENPIYCELAKDPVPEGGEDVQPTDGDLYCLRELVSVIKDVSICNQYAPNDSVCIWRATYLGE